MQPWIRMECLQLSPGRQLGRMECMDLGGQQIVREHQDAAVQKLGATPDNLCTLSYCTLDPAFRFSEYDAANADAIFFMPGRTEFDIHVPAGAQTTYVTFDHDAFLSAARILNPSQWSGAGAGLTAIRSRDKRRFAEAVDLCFQAGKMATASGVPLDTVGMQTSLFQTLLHVVTASLDAHRPLPPAARVKAMQICRQARNLAEDRAVTDEPPSVVELCSELGVSQRTLQYAFSTHMGMSPMAYLRLLRLNRVQAILCRAEPGDTTVTATAMHHGFLHLGRFAQDYKRIFNESPSATLAR